MNKLKWCSNCLAMSTRPRISFDERGWCNACRWMEEKRKIDWNTRNKELEILLEKYSKKNGDFDVLVPVSGGKDGSYVSHKLKNDYGLNPLCLTVTPALPSELGEKNLASFIDSGFNHISVNCSHEAMRVLNRRGFIEIGFPYFGWLTAIQSIPVRFALKFGIGLIFYGEDGEVEYGGTDETKNQPIYDVTYQKKIYLEGGYDQVILNSGLEKSDLSFFTFPDEKELNNNNVNMTHWSYFENWDPYRNYLIAKKYCGLQESLDGNSGTFTNFSQNDQYLYHLHTYVMFLKFGFGRANQDASIEIRRGAMDREQAINLVKLYDGQYPEEYINIYLDYYKMTKIEFDKTLDKWVNKNIFKKVNGRWLPNFEIV